MSGYKSSLEVPMKFNGFCSYPSCRHKKIEKDKPFVSWHGVNFPIEEVNDDLSSMAKLAAIANPSEWVEKFGYYGFNMELHPECAAEWGMHLIQNAIAADSEIGRIFSKRDKNAICK